MAVLTAEKVIQYYDSLGPCRWKRNHHRVDWDIDAAEKGGYAHFMLKEIMEQPEAIRGGHCRPASRDGRVIFEGLSTMTPEDDPQHRAHHLSSWPAAPVLPCGHGGQVQPGAADSGKQRGGGAGLRVPLQRPHCKAGGLWSSPSASPARPWTPWRPCGRPRSRGARILSIVNVVGSLHCPGV